MKNNYLAETVYGPSTGNGRPVLMMAGQKGSEQMGEKEKEIAEKVAEALPNMSERDKGYFLGYAEGIISRDKRDAEEGGETDGSAE